MSKVMRARGATRGVGEMKWPRKIKRSTCMQHLTFGKCSPHCQRDHVEENIDDDTAEEIIPQITAGLAALMAKA
jgi:hypothetical protein